MAFPAGTDTRIIVALELQATADYYQEVREQMQRVTEGGGTSAETAILDLLTDLESAITAWSTAQASTDAAIKRVDVIEFRDAGSTVGFSNEVQRLRTALVRLLGLEFLMAWMSRKQGGGRYSIRYMRSPLPMERYL